jgi:hypothetical protein
VAGGAQTLGEERDVRALARAVDALERDESCAGRSDFGAYW